MKSTTGQTETTLFARWQQAAKQITQRLPSQCWVCHRWPSHWLCADCTAACWQREVRRCQRCALALPAASDICPACLRDAPVLTECHAAVDYGSPWDGMVQQFKFHQHLAWASRMAEMLVATPGILACLQQATVMLPVPLSAERLRERGYNQALLLAQALGKVSATQAVLHGQWLLRLTGTPAQIGLARAERLRNLRRAFAPAPGAVHVLRGQHVLLIDDVMTTGATLSSLAKMLLALGVSRVDAIVFARTPLPANA